MQTGMATAKTSKTMTTETATMKTTKARRTTAETTATKTTTAKWATTRMTTTKTKPAKTATTKTKTTKMQTLIHVHTPDLRFLALVFPHAILQNRINMISHRLALICCTTAHPEFPHALPNDRKN